MRFQSIPLRAAQHRNGQLRLRLHRRRRDELEEERSVADDDLAARILGQSNLIGALRGAAPGRAAPSRSEMPVGSATRPVIPSRKFRWYSLPTSSKSRKDRREDLRPDHEHVLFVRADRDVDALLMMRSSITLPPCTTPMRRTFGPVAATARITAVICRGDLKPKFLG